MCIRDSFGGGYQFAHLIVAVKVGYGSLQISLGQQMEAVRTGLDGAANANCQPQSNQGRDNDSRDKQNKGDNDPQDGCASKIGGWGIDSLSLIHI